MTTEASPVEAHRAKVWDDLSPVEQLAAQTLIDAGRVWGLFVTQRLLPAAHTIVAAGGDVQELKSAIAMLLREAADELERD